MREASFKLSEEHLREIEEICKLEGIDRDTALHKLIGEALKEYRVKKAFELYREGKISLWKAAEMAKITYREALEEIKLRNIPFKYEEEDLESDIKWAIKK